ncbi:sunset domain-containing protein [Actinophytocola sediminis]
MPIFGQVWLWSSLAFLLGALLCWGLVALPARRRVGELEAELTARARRQPQNEPRRGFQDERPDFDARQLVAGADRDTDRPGDRPDDRPGDRSEADGGPLTRAYALAGPRSGGVSAPPEVDTELSDGPRATATQYINVSGSGSLAAPPEVPGRQEGDLGWFDDKERRAAEAAADSPAATTVLPQVPAEPLEPRPVESRLVDAAEPDDGGTVFTQRTHPIPGELIRQLDGAEETSAESAHALVTDHATETPVADERGILAELDATGESKHQLSPDPAVTSVLTPTADPVGAESAHGAYDRTVVVPAHTAEVEVTDEVVSASGWHGAASDRSTPGTEEPKIMPGVTVQAEPKNKLPKRVPSKPAHRTPFGIETTSPASPTAAPTTSEPAAAVASANEAPRSLFEPIVPAGDGPEVPPPPHRLRGANGRSPFGPGSAMPGPDGTPPSPEFTVKASASAMRYCTRESEKYERTVAEVWFRSPADAERVGFRPLG